LAGSIEQFPDIPIEVGESAFEIGEAGRLLRMAISWKGNLCSESHFVALRQESQVLRVWMRSMREDARLGDILRQAQDWSKTQEERLGKEPLL